MTAPTFYALPRSIWKESPMAAPDHSQTFAGKISKMSSFVHPSVLLRVPPDAVIVASFAWLVRSFKSLP